MMSAFESPSLSSTSDAGARVARGRNVRGGTHEMGWTPARVRCSSHLVMLGGEAELQLRATRSARTA